MGGRVGAEGGRGQVYQGKVRLGMGWTADSAFAPCQTPEMDQATQK